MDFARLLAELQKIWPNLLDGVGVTLLSAACGIVAGSAVGFAIGLAVHYGRWPLRLAMWAYLDLVRGTPVLVLMLASFYIAPVLGLQLAPIWAGVAALAVFCSAHVAEVVRGGLTSIPKGQTEAARAIGLTFPKILLWVLLPQLLRQALPAWVNTAVEIAKATTLLSVIGVADLMYATQRIVSRNFMNAEFYLLVGLAYIAINIGIAWIGKRIERRIAH